MRSIVLILAALILLSPAALAVVEPPVAPPIPIGNGVFTDPGELVATVAFRFLDDGCLGDAATSGLAYMEIIRHFLSADKLRYVWADMMCLPGGDAGQQAITLIGNEALTPASNLKLAGGGAPGTLIVLAGTYRDGYMAVHVP